MESEISFLEFATKFILLTSLNAGLRNFNEFY